MKLSLGKFCQRCLHVAVSAVAGVFAVAISLFCWLLPRLHCVSKAGHLCQPWHTLICWPAYLCISEVTHIFTHAPTRPLVYLLAHTLHLLVVKLMVRQQGWSHVLAMAHAYLLASLPNHLLIHVSTHQLTP